MNNFFNPNIKFDPSNPQGFDYQSQAQQLALAQAIAQRMGKPLDGGQMVSGWYVGPGKGATVANALQQALGGYMQVKGMQNQQDLDKADRDAMFAARKMYQDASDPENYIERAKQAIPTPQAGYTNTHPELVGPQAEDAAQTFQVRPQPSMGGQPLPGVAGAPMIGGMPQSAANPMETARQMFTMQMGPATETPVQTGFNVTQPTPEEVADAQRKQVKYLRREMSADRDTALDRLSRTKSGAPLANAILTRDFAPGKVEKLKVGDEEVLVEVGPNGVRNLTQPTGVESADTQIKRKRLELDAAREEREAAAAANTQGVKATDRARGMQEALASNNHAIRQIDELLPMVGEATGITGKISNAFSNATGIATDSGIANERLESIKGGLLAAAMRMTKEQSGTAAGLSQVESEALQKSIASLNPRVGEVELKRQLNEVKRLFRQYGDRMSGAGEAAVPAAPSTTYKVPARGQRVTSPEDYGF